MQGKSYGRDFTAQMFICMDPGIVTIYNYSYTGEYKRKSQLKVFSELGEMTGRFVDWNTERKKTEVRGQEFQS